MKSKIKYIMLSLLATMMILSSCLTDNTESIEEFSNNDISDVVGVWYRYVGLENPTSTREVLKKAELDGITKAVDKNTRTATIKVKPSAGRVNSLPADAKSKLSINNIAVVVALPTAARIAPIGDAPKLGINGDWSKPNKYLVTAANGDTAEWTITITEFTLP